MVFQDPWINGPYQWCLSQNSFPPYPQHRTPFQPHGTSSSCPSNVAVSSSLQPCLPWAGALPNQAHLQVHHPGPTLTHPQGSAWCTWGWTCPWLPLLPVPDLGGGMGPGCQTLSCCSRGAPKGRAQREPKSHPGICSENCDFLHEEILSFWYCIFIFEDVCNYDKAFTELCSRAKSDKELHFQLPEMKAEVWETVMSNFHLHRVFQRS